MRDRLRVFGIDVIKGSVRSRSRRPMYALVRMEGQTIESESEVSMFRLFRALNEEQPDILAVDSLQEIAADQHELFFFLQNLPPQTRLVQVTGGNARRHLARLLHGITSALTGSIPGLKPGQQRRLHPLEQVQKSLHLRTKVMLW